MVFSLFAYPDEHPCWITEARRGFHASHTTICRSHCGYARRSDIVGWETEWRLLRKAARTHQWTKWANSSDEEIERINRAWTFVLIQPWQFTILVCGMNLNEWLHSFTHWQCPKTTKTSTSPRSLLSAQVIRTHRCIGDRVFFLSTTLLFPLPKSLFWPFILW